MRPAIASILFVLPLLGCEFWRTPEPEPPDPNRDALLECGDDEIVDGYPAGSGLAVEAARGVGVELLTDFDNEFDGARLAIQSGSQLRRVLEVWDPARDRRVMPATVNEGDELVLELIQPEGGNAAGTVSMRCADPGELCFNLADDDGDGRTDCADLACARDPGCVDDQEDLEEVVATCTDGLESLTPPTLSTIDDQRTLYATSPGGGEQPPQEFWGGAELVLRAEGDIGSMTLQFDSAGLVCAGQPSPDVVLCIDPIRVEAGDEVTLDFGERDVWLEPLDLAWAGVRVGLDCGADG